MRGLVFLWKVGASLEVSRKVPDFDGPGRNYSFVLIKLITAQYHKINMSFSWITISVISKLYHLVKHGRVLWYGASLEVFKKVRDFDGLDRNCSTP